MSDYYEQSQDSTVKRDNEDDARLMSMLIFPIGVLHFCNRSNYYLGYQAQ